MKKTRIRLLHVFLVFVCHDETFLLLLNAHSQTVPFRMPQHVGIARWGVVIDTCFGDGERPDRRTFNTGQTYPLEARSVTLLKLLKHPR